VAFASSGDRPIHVGPLMGGSAHQRGRV